MKVPRSSDANARRRGGVLMGLLITAAALVCMAIVLGVTVARNVHVETTNAGNGEKDVSINTPGGSFSIRAHEHDGAAMVGVPLYPGARRVKSGGGAEFEWTSSDGREQKGLTVSGAEMVTQDPASKVYDYYHSELPSWVVSHERNGEIKLSESLRDDAKRFVVIREKFDGTHIGVASVGAPAAN